MILLLKSNINSYFSNVHWNSLLWKRWIKLYYICSQSSRSSVNDWNSHLESRKFYSCRQHSPFRVVYVYFFQLFMSKSNGKNINPSKYFWWLFCLTIFIAVILQVTIFIGRKKSKLKPISTNMEKTKNLKHMVIIIKFSYSTIKNYQKPWN